MSVSVFVFVYAEDQAGRWVGFLRSLRPVLSLSLIFLMMMTLVYDLFQTKHAKY